MQVWKQFNGAVAVASAQSVLGPWTLMPPAAADLVNTTVPSDYIRGVVGTDCMALRQREPRRRCILAERDSWAEQHMILEVAVLCMCISPSV